MVQWNVCLALLRSSGVFLTGSEDKKRPWHTTIEQCKVCCELLESEKELIVYPSSRGLNPCDLVNAVCSAWYTTFPPPLSAKNFHTHYDTAVPTHQLQVLASDCRGFDETLYLLCMYSYMHSWSLLVRDNKFVRSAELRASASHI